VTLTEEDAVLAEFEEAVGRMKGEQVEQQVEQQWRETMRQCEKCRAWVNRHMKTDDLVRVCPNFNLCEGRA